MRMMTNILLLSDWLHAERTSSAAFVVMELLPYVQAFAPLGK